MYRREEERERERERRQQDDTLLHRRGPLSSRKATAAGAARIPCRSNHHHLETSCVLEGAKHIDLLRIGRGARDPRHHTALRDLTPRGGEEPCRSRQRHREPPAQQPPWDHQRPMEPILRDRTSEGMPTATCPPSTTPRTATGSTAEERSSSG